MEMEIGQIITQIIAFLVIYWVMKKVAWKPFLAMLEARKNEIRNQFATIEKKKEEADRLENVYQKKLSELDLLAQQKVKEALIVGQQKALEIEMRAKEEAAEFLKNAKKRLEEDACALKISLRNEVASLACQIAEQAISEKLDPEKEKKLAESLLDKAGFS